MSNSNGIRQVVRFGVPLESGTFFFLICLLSFSSVCAAFSQLPPREPGQIERLAQQAELDLRNQRPAQAAEAYQKILMLDPENLSAHSNLGLAYYLQGKDSQAVSEFRIALAKKPDLWNIAALCGQAEAKTGQNAGAIVHLRQAFQHVADPSLRAASGQQLFSILFQADDLNEAASVAEELEKLEPTNIDVLYAEHQVYSEMADKAFLAVAQLDPTSARMYQLSGDRMVWMGNMAGAIAAYRMALERDPHLSGAHFVLAEALSISTSATERTEAEAEYKKALADNPFDERAECGLGEIDIERSDLEGAAEHFKRALALQPDDPDANEGMGKLLLQADSTNEARNYLERAVRLDPNNAVAHYRLSQASRKLGDLDSAKREMERFLQLKAEKDNLSRTFHDFPIRDPARDTQSAGHPSQPETPGAVPAAPDKPKP
jgi:tetratricopeptide (TPR) repeat protein